MCDADAVVPNNVSIYPSSDALPHHAIRATPVVELFTLEEIFKLFLSSNWSRWLSFYPPEIRTGSLLRVMTALVGKSFVTGAIPVPRLFLSLNST